MITTERIVNPWTGDTLVESGVTVDRQMLKHLRDTYGPFIFRVNVDGENKALDIGRGKG